ncbi:hypothetical protein ABIF69_005891 [Bradyrhizobium japonicum]
MSELLSDELVEELIGVLLEIPVMEIPSTRWGYFSQAPGAQYFTRIPDNQRLDLRYIVRQLQWNHDAAGEWVLPRIIAQIERDFAGSKPARRLASVRERIVRARPAPRHPGDLTVLHLFDLKPIIAMWVDLQSKEPALSGFAVPTGAECLLDYLSDSVKDNGAAKGFWAKGKAVVLKPFLLDPVHTPIESVRGEIAKLRGLLGTKSLIWAAYAREAADVDSLWGELRDLVPPQPQHHLVALFGMPPGVRSPEGVMELPAPRFTRRHLREWAEEIARARKWTPGAIDRWAEAIVKGFEDCAAGLPIEKVYDRLKCHVEAVTRDREEDEFMQSLQYRM